jgi:hypothetical protein
MKPWYDVVKPREDLREGRPLDASEFAVHLDHVRDGRGADVYRKPRRLKSFDVGFSSGVDCPGKEERRLPNMASGSLPTDNRCRRGFP